MNLNEMDVESDEFFNEAFNLVKQNIDADDDLCPQEMLEVVFGDHGSRAARMAISLMIAFLKDKMGIDLSDFGISVFCRTAYAYHIGVKKHNGSD